MKNRGVILLALVLILASMIAFDISNQTGFIIREEPAQTVAGPPEKTEIKFLQNDVSRSTFIGFNRAYVELAVTPGRYGVESVAKLYYMNRYKGLELKKTLTLCAKKTCTDKRTVRMSISKADRPGNYVLVVNDKIYGEISEQFNLKS